jgi:hypothetical protein
VKEEKPKVSKAVKKEQQPVKKDLKRTKTKQGEIPRKKPRRSISIEILDTSSDEDDGEGFRIMISGKRVKDRENRRNK